MLFTTFPQVLALLILFLAGLILGLGLHPGGAKWKRRFKDESDNYAAYRRAADTAQRDSNHRIAELEAELARLKDRPAEQPYAPVVAASEARPAFGHGDLSRIRGIDPVLRTRLTALGITGYDDIEQLTAEDEMALEQRLAVPAGQITREQWREQARLLRTGQDAEHAERFPPR